MTGTGTPEGANGPGEQQASEGRTARNIGVGCFASFVGLWSGAMVAVLIGRLVEGARGSPGCQGLPICNWYVYALVGAVIGALSLPVLVQRRLARSDAVREPTTRG
jgi:hypothetical protein